ncbi:hypothetical protein B7486_56640 [cyanobacterium TDX16]|nr:hypothetical protein B7486_56640 [cyanobacterium TDX16]
MAGRALPASYVHDGERQRDVRSLVLEAVARNPRAAAELLAGADLHGTPNVHRLIGDELLDPMGPGILDGDAGRALAQVIDAATVPPTGPVGPWGRVSPEEQSAAAGAVVAGFGDRAHVLGWELPDALHESLRDLVVRTLPTFQMAPPSFGDLDLPVPAGVAPVVGRERGLRFLSLLFTRRSSEDVVVAAAEGHVQAESDRLGADDHDGHLALGLLWGALTDASIAGRLVQAIRQDHARDEQRAAWELGQSAVELYLNRRVGNVVVGPVGGWLTTKVAQHPVQDRSGDAIGAVGARLEDELLPDEQRTEQLVARADSIVRERGERLDRVLAVPPGSAAWAAATAGHLAAVGPNVAPPGYQEPNAAVLVELNTIAGEAPGIGEPDLRGVGEAFDAAGRLVDGARRG